MTFAAVGPAWFVMVLPTYAAWKYNWGLYWAWAFASAYIAILALIFIARFIHGKWKTMRVIEQAPADDQATIAEEVAV